MNVLLGIDIGTYSSKGVLVKETGEVIASHVVPHQLSMPKQGWAEHDADGVWWHDFVVICRHLLDHSGIKPGQIAGVGVSSISPCVLPIDSAGRPLRPAILYGIDTRASQEVLELEQLIGKETLFTRYGTQLSAQSVCPKILWLRKNEPEVWAKTSLLLYGTGYIVFKLTGEAVIDIYDVSAHAPLFDITTLDWNPEMASIIAPLRMLPRITWTCAIAGRVSRQAAQATGLAAGTPVITGTADAAAEAISAGLANTGDLMVMYGSSIFFILKAASLSTSRRYSGCHFLEQGTYAVAGGMFTGGSITRWFRDQFASQEIEEEARGGVNSYAALAELASHSPRGANGLILLPYFGGDSAPIHDPQARGLICGLTLRHTRADLYRAVLEGIGHSIRHNINALQEEGTSPQRILAVGGGALNLAWMQIVSDIANIEQHIPTEQIGASYGDAFLAGIGIGMFNSTAEAARWVKIKRVVQPDPEAHVLYREVHRIYRDLYAQTAESMHRLSQL